MFLNAIKKRIPLKLKIFLIHGYKPLLKEYKLKKEIKQIRESQKGIVNKLRKENKIKIIFLVIHHSVWKYEEVYRLLEKDPKFNIRVVIIPLVKEGLGDMEVYNKTLNYFDNSKYNVIPSYDKINNSWLDIKVLTKPDIIFFTNPHKLTYDKYYIDNFTDKLTCYVPYAFVVIHSIEMHYNQKIHQVLWKYFVETKHHFDFANLFTKYNNDNVVITGFPSLDKKYCKEYKPRSVWKDFRNGNTIKIIWAPHHTISGQGAGLDYSSFMEYAEYFIDLLETRNDIQIAFKPHPLLKEKLYVNEFWGIEKTNKYYEQWDELPNGQLEEGSYIDLFELSDAMIMDSASFIVEYLYFNKPILFTMHDETVLDRFNSFGKIVFDYLYKSSNKLETFQFISVTVIDNKDVLKESRNKFLHEEILPKNGKTASENIYNELKKELC